MKKHGFTLAEVLVTLGIIGIVSALTLPTFTQGTSNAKIGPMLGKAKSSFEQATTAVLNEAQSDSLTSAMLCPATTPACTPAQRVAVTGSWANFAFNLGHYLKGSNKNNTNRIYQSDDGTIYQFITNFGSPTASQFPHDEVLVTEVMIDINGEQGPNRASKDRFYFELRNDGSLVPFGRMETNATARTKYNFTTNADWETDCAKNAVPAHAEACAAHVIDNGLKAEYK